MRSRRLPGLFFAMHLLLASCMVAGAQTNKPESSKKKKDEEKIVRMDARLGYGQGQITYRANSWTPLQVIVENETKDNVKGTLVIEKKEKLAGDCITRHTLKIEAAPKSKKVYSFLVWVGDNEGQVDIRMEAGSRTVGYSSIRLMGSHRYREMVLVVAKSDAGYRHFVRINRRGMETPQRLPERYVLREDPRALPFSPLGLLPASAIVTEVNVYCALTDEQRTALRQYVEMGGRLVISGCDYNPRISKVITGEFCPVTVGDGYFDMGTEILEAYGLKTDPKRKIPVARTTPTEGARVVLEKQGVPLVVQKQRGMGVVTFVAFDLKDPNVAVLPHVEFFIDDVLGEPEVPIFRSHDSFTVRKDQYPVPNVRAQLEMNVRAHSMKAIPSVWYVIALLGAYIVVLVPLNYIIFKCLRKTEYAWFVLPVLAVSFSTVALATGLVGQARELSACGVSIVECTAGSSVGVGSHVVGFYSPVHEDYALSCAETNAMMFHSRAQLGHRGLGRLVIDSDWASGMPETGVEIHARSQRFMEIDSMVPLRDGFSAHVVKLRDSFRLRVRNGTGYDLDNAVLVCMDQARALGALPSGSATDIVFQVSSLESWDKVVAEMWAEGAGEAGEGKPALKEEAGRTVSDYTRSRRSLLGPVFLLGRHDGLAVNVKNKDNRIMQEGLTVFVVRLPVDLAPGRHTLSHHFLASRLVEANAEGIGNPNYRGGRLGGEYGIWRYTVRDPHAQGRLRNMQIDKISPDKFVRGIDRTAASHNVDLLVRRGFDATLVTWTRPPGETREWWTVTGQRPYSRRGYEEPILAPELTVVMDVD